MTKLSDFIGAIINPQSGKSFLEELRIVELKENGQEFFLKYKRDGIPLEQKKEIEQKIFLEAKKYYTEDNISILSFSTLMTSPAPSSAPSSAELKTGHGTTFNKKKIPHVQKVIAIASGKGGVGKSAVAVNLALALQKLGKKVGILDADIYGPSIPLLLGKKEEKPVVDDNKKIIPLQAYGIKFMSFGLFIAEGDAVIWRGPMLNGVLNQFFFDVNWQDVDYLLIDLPPGTGDVQLSMVQNAFIDGALVISTPQDAAVMNAMKAAAMFKKVNVPVLGLIENMSSFICSKCDEEHFIFGKSGVSEIAKKQELEFFGSIPLQVELREGSDAGIPFMSQDKFIKTPVAKAFLGVAEKLILTLEPTVETDKKPSFLGRLFS
ncbi:MAG: Mrp/NBP35 family ATP-binding protein [Bacteriovoracaceae bacterium]|nr:Mrp/NBP35 family ATP-binding protein [Bacteriovoracaceae bacterium]